MRLSLGALAVTVILTGTLAAASCAFDGATVIIAAAIVTAQNILMIRDFIGLPLFISFFESGSSLHLW